MAASERVAEDAWARVEALADLAERRLDSMSRLLARFGGGSYVPTDSPMRRQPEDDPSEEPPTSPGRPRSA